MSTLSPASSADILKAFDISGRVPSRGNWDDGGCACGLGAIIAATTPQSGPGRVIPRWEAESRWGEEYVRGFTDAWDGEEPVSTYPDYQRGYNDGIAAFCEAESKFGPAKDWP